MTRQIKIMVREQRAKELDRLEEQLWKVEREVDEAIQQNECSRFVEAIRKRDIILQRIRCFMAKNQLKRGINESMRVDLLHSEIDIMFNNKK